MSKRGRASVWLAAVVASGGLGACGAPEPAPAEVPVVVATYQRSEAGGDMALLAGVLAKVDDCLVVRGVNGVTMVYFPQDAVGSVTADSVVLFGTMYSLGGW